MQYKTLGNTDLRVSIIGLGGSFWGGGVSRTDAFSQMDHAYDRGVNFIDTAEIYPVPYSEHTWGDSERIIGEWVKRKQFRDKIYLSAKVPGRLNEFAYIREGYQKLDRFNITASLDASLKRLQTDYIDLYQLHWPDRNIDFSGWSVNEPLRESSSPIEETLGVLRDLITTGKVRAVGLCNETPWGMMRFLSLSEQSALPRIASIQYRYNLLARTFEVGHAEVAVREGCSLIAYSPLAHGTLSGKYIDGSIPSGSRLDRYPFFKRYRNSPALQAAEAYAQIAEKYDIAPTQMAIAFVMSRPYVGSVLVSSSDTNQLHENLASVEVSLPDKLVQDLEEYHRINPNPAS